MKVLLYLERRYLYKLLEAFYLYWLFELSLKGMVCPLISTRLSDEVFLNLSELLCNTLEELIRIVLLLTS